MIYCYPIINGKKERHTFIETWEECPLNSFIQWQGMVGSLVEVEEAIRSLNGEIVTLSNSHEEHYFKKEHVAAGRVLNKIKGVQVKVEKLQDERHVLEVQGISFFCSVPLNSLMEMETRSFYLPVGLTDVPDNYKEIPITDNHINAYKGRLYMLSTCKLPTDACREFTFQGATDKEIQDLQVKYNSLSFFSKIKREARELLSQINAAKSVKYSIKDLWEQTTTVNKEFQSLANDIVRELKEGQFTQMPYLLAMLTVEGSTEGEALERIAKNTTVKNYVEEYNAEFKRIYQRRVKLFTEQKAQITVGIAIRIKNFFLSS